MRAGYVISIGLAFLLPILSVQAQDSACMFAANAPATVYIEYSYDTSEGSGTERGTGFVVSPQGHVITAAHVVTPSLKDVEVQSASVIGKVGGLLNPPTDVQVLVRDPANDLALLKLPDRPEGSEWPVVTIAARSDLSVGAPLLALGYAGGDVAVIPNGEKTANNTMVDGQLMPWWQTNLALNAGNSGGPIFDSLGTVVGVAVAKGTNNQLVSHVVPITRAQHLLDAASVEAQQAGLCAVFPECRHETHGLEGYQIDTEVDQWGGWRRGGYNRAAACNDFLATLRSQFPNSVFTFVRDGEDQRRTGTFNEHAEYNYYCAFRRQEGPIWHSARSAACLN